MDSPASALKKDLKKEFPGIKFSVTSSRRSVNVSWEMGIITLATVSNVREIAKKHETLECFGDGMNDTAWSTGYDVSLSPSYTQERKDWARDSVIAKNYSDATWNDKWQRFDNTSTGKEDYWATKKYYEYLQNGVATALVDEHGSEPSEKRWYYQDLEKQAETVIETSTETIKIETVEEIITPSNIYSLAEPIYIQGKFPSLNKQDWLEDYVNQTESNIVKVKISEIIELTPQDYETFTYSLLMRREWLDGKGGNDSTYETEYEDMISLRNDKDEYKKWLKEVYTIAVVVTNGSDYILIDPQGYSYARYVGFGVNVKLEDILNKTETVEPEEIKTDSNILQFPTKNQTQNINDETINVNDYYKSKDFYSDIYKAWVNKMILNNQYEMIKSFDDWFSIAKDII